VTGHDTTVAKLREGDRLMRSVLTNKVVITLALVMALAVTSGAWLKWD
jgi:hypothetical protein